MSKAEQLIKLLDYNLVNKKYENAVKLLDDEQYLPIFISHYPEVIQEVLLKHLNAENYANQPSLYEVCEAILKLLADKCQKEGILFEFLEIIETVKDDDIFTSILKCLQVIVLNQSEKKSRALEYCLNSIEDYVLELPLPNELLKNAEEDEEKVLENDDQIRRVLMMYMTLELFYDPIVKQILEQQSSNVKAFRSNRFNRRNVLFCFVLRLLGKPLSYLDLSHDEASKKVKTYSRQIAENIVSTLCKLHSDVFRLLEYSETRCRWPAKEKVDDDLSDIFLHNDKAPLIQIGMLFYLVIAEEIKADTPKIYSPSYIFEKGIYLVDAMITSDNAVIFKGLKLCSKMLEKIVDCNLSSSELEVDIHRTFCNNLVKLLIYSPSLRNRQKGLAVLRSYILKFDIHGRFILIKNILRSSNHKGLLAYLTTLYKDIVFEELNTGNLSEFTRGTHFKELTMDHFCSLTDNVQCDIADSSDQINASLNFLIALFLRDKENLTGIKDCIHGLEKGFLGELRKALDISRAHYFAEIENVKSGKSVNVDDILRDTEILNGPEPLGSLTMEKKLDMLHSALSMFDLIDYQLARVNEILSRI